MQTAAVSGSFSNSEHNSNCEKTETRYKYLRRKYNAQKQAIRKYINVLKYIGDYGVNPHAQLCTIATWRIDQYVDNGNCLLTVTSIDPFVLMHV